MKKNDSVAVDTGTSKSFSLEAEQAILGSVLIDPSCFSTVSMLVRPEYFYMPQHKSIYTAMLSIDAAGNGAIDPLLLLEMLRVEKVFSNDDDGKTYLFQLADIVPSTSNVESYCKIIKDKFYIRTLVDVSTEIIDLAENSGQEADIILDNAEQRIYDIRQGKTVAGPSKLSDVIANVYDMLYKLNSEDKEQFKGLPTGFPDFDKMCTGLNRSDLVLIGARPAMGKTSFALNMARNVAVKSGKRVLFFSLEMSKEQLAQRVISTEARIPSQKMRTGELTPKEWESLSAACVFLADVPLYFDDTANITVPEMKARCRRLKNVDAVFIDYLQLMQSAKKTENRVQEVSEITRSLKLMAKDLQIPVVVCAQLSRSTEGRGSSHKPQLADLRESGSIEQDADIVVMLYREDYYKNEKDNPEEIEVNTAELLVQKNRHGPTGSVKMAWNPQFTLYTCVENNKDDEN
ncbi:MAG: replicative DNA helicase [Ruminococcaceae bacterium]|nr:replicative DNA helicase [Oscillospiraceae bacterium]